MFWSAVIYSDRPPPHPAMPCDVHDDSYGTGVDINTYEEASSVADIPGPGRTAVTVLFHARDERFAM